MRLIKDNFSYVLKLFINHFVSGIYSLVLFMVMSTAFSGKYVSAASVIATLFYLHLVYSFMWECGSKSAVRYNSHLIKKTDGLIIMSAGSAPFYATTMLCTLLSFFTTNSKFAEKTVDVLYRVFFYITALFSQCMYSGFLSELFNGLPNVSSLIYLATLLPGLIVAALAYNFGTKNFRLRTIFGIKYDQEKEKIKNNY